MTKERLRKYQLIKKEREQLRQKLEEVEAALYYPKVQQLTGMPGSGSKENNPQEDLAIYHMELQDLYKAKIDELAGEQLAIERAIEALEPTARMLMRHRYLEGLKWEEVCVKMNYSWSQTHEIHKKILIRLREDEANEKQAQRPE